jgi:hypothetical protein
VSSMIAVAANASSAAHWGYIQTIYGLARLLNGNGVVAWIAQGSTTIGLAIIVWLVWRSSARHSLKAATLSAAALIATPYAFTYDVAAIAVPVAFLARDQLRCGFLRGEQSIEIGLFAATFAVLMAFGDRPGGAHLWRRAACSIRDDYPFVDNFASHLSAGHVGLGEILPGSRIR